MSPKKVFFLYTILIIISVGCLQETAPSTPITTEEPTKEIVETIPTIRITEIPTEVPVGGDINIAWTVTGEDLIAVHSAIHYGTESNTGSYGTDLGPPGGYPSLTREFVSGEFSLPMDFSTSIPTDTAGNIYLRAHAVVEGKNYWTDEAVVAVKILEHEHGHGVPIEAQKLENPISASEASISAGQKLYTANCLSCHGSEGRGDGTMASMLDPKPSNLHEMHVQVNTDGAIFYIIENGVEGSAMPAFGQQLSEGDIWNIVNFLRTFEIEEMNAHGQDDHGH